MVDRSANPLSDSSQVSSRAAVSFAVSFAVTLALILAVLWLWYRRVNPPARAAETFPLLSQPLEPSPAHPFLPAQDLAALHAEQVSLLHTTGPVPGDPAHVRIPIDDAIDRLLDSGQLRQPWTIPATQPWQHPANQNTPSVENRS